MIGDICGLTWWFVDPLVGFVSSSGSRLVPENFELQQVVVAETPCRNSCSVWKPRRPPKSWFKLRASSNFSISGWWFGTFFIFSYFPCFGKNHPNWLKYFSEGLKLKPPTRYFSGIMPHIFLDVIAFHREISGPILSASSRAAGLSVGAAPWWGWCVLCQLFRCWCCWEGQGAGEHWWQKCIEMCYWMLLGWTRFNC